MSKLCILWGRSNTTAKGRVKAQAVSRRPLTAEAQVRSQVSPCGICDGQSGDGTCFSPSTSVLPCQFYSTGAPLYGKTKQKKLIIFFTGLHNKPQGCGVSIASAAGPFTTKKTLLVISMQDFDTPWCNRFSRNRTLALWRKLGRLHSTQRQIKISLTMS